MSAAPSPATATPRPTRSLVLDAGGARRPGPGRAVRLLEHPGHHPEARGRVPVLHPGRRLLDPAARLRRPSAPSPRPTCCSARSRSPSARSRSTTIGRSRAAGCSTLIGTEAAVHLPEPEHQPRPAVRAGELHQPGRAGQLRSGPLSVSVAGTDGFFSDEITWFTGNVAYKLDDYNTIGVNGGLNLGRHQRLRPQPALPVRHAGLPAEQRHLRHQLHLRERSVDRLAVLPVHQRRARSARRHLRQRLDLWRRAAGGLLVHRQLRPGGPRRVRGADGRAGLRHHQPAGFGAGSNAFSVTVTPTFTFDRYFLRVEYAHVELGGITRGNLADGTLGTGFGRTGNRTSQDRYMVETGITF